MITLSLPECDVIAAEVAELAHRLRSVALSHRFSLATQHAVLGNLMRQVVALDQAAAHLRELARRYDAGETTITHSFSQAAGVIGRAVAPAFSVGVAMLSRAASALGLLESGPVQVAGTGANKCLPPTGFAGALERIPSGAAQIRIERVNQAGGASYFVYIAGTRDFEIHPSTQPWDMMSNLQALAGGDGLAGTRRSDSEQAVRDAMAQAGIDARTRVVLVGHSQGGLIAERLAASGDYNVTDVITAGAPAHNVDISPAVRLTAFEHTNDVIPALSGVVLAGTSALFVREKAPRPMRPATLPAHELTGYVTTAKSADRSSDPVLAARKQQIAGNQAASCTAQEFEASRAVTGGK